MEKRLLMFLVGLFLSIGMAVAQTQVKGTVVSSEDGEPVVGASVMISGTKTGTITDAEESPRLCLASAQRKGFEYGRNLVVG